VETCTITGGVGSWTETGNYGQATDSGSGNFTIDGNFDTISSSIAQAAGKVFINGNNDVATLAPNAYLTISGLRDTATMQGGGDVIISGNNPSLNIDGNGVLVKDAAGITGGVVNFLGTDEIGDLNSTKITLGQSDSLTANGTADDVFGGGDCVIALHGADMAATILAGDGLVDTGGGGAITAAAGSSVWVGDVGDPTTTVTANNLALGGSQTAANGNQLGILVGANSSAIIDGQHDGVQTGANALITDNGFDLTANLGAGSGGIFNSGGATINAGANVGLILNGGSLADTVTVNNDAFGGTAAGGIATGISAAANTQFNLYGSGDGATLQSGDVATLYGNTDVTTAIDATVKLVGDLNTTVFGQGTVTGNVIDAPGGDDNGNITVGGAGGMDIVNWAGGNGVGADSWTAQFNPTGSETAVIADWTAPSGAGTLIDQLTDWSAGGSQLGWYNPETGVSSVIANFTQANEGGNITTENLYTTTGYTEDFTFDYSGGQFIGAVEKYYDGNTYLGYADFNGYGQETGGEGYIGSYGSYEGGYDFANSLGGASKSKGQNISKIAAYDLEHGRLGAAAAAESARYQSQLTSLAPASAGVLAPGIHAARWTSGTITWALATGRGSAASPFSGDLSASYLALVQKAFAAWAAATGLKFAEVSASAPTDIRIGWGAFDSATSAVLGYTSSPVKAGVFQSGAEIRLEDSALTALIIDGAGQLAYAGTDAELEQVLMHEIGHAIGLGDSADPNSIMNAIAGTQDRSISSSDIAAVKALYAAAPDASTALASQAFKAPDGAQISPVGVDRTPVGQANVLTGSALSSALAAAHIPAAVSRFAQASAALAPFHGLEGLGFYPQAPVRMDLAGPHPALA
jgi:hypothetical protein